jgi:hypothetical protein
MYRAVYRSVYKLVYNAVCSTAYIPRHSAAYSTVRAFFPNFGERVP